MRTTYDEVPRDVVDDVILVDDASRDNTVEVARRLGIKHFAHAENRGYGGNQKTCYAQALAEGADIVVMVHPDYQYTPKLITRHGGHGRLGRVRRGPRLAHPRHRRPGAAACPSTSTSPTAS